MAPDSTANESSDCGGNLQQQRLQRERDEALAALWRIHMAAKRASINDPVWQLPNTVIHIALGALGKNKAEAQRLAAGTIGNDEEGNPLPDKEQTRDD